MLKIMGQHIQHYCTFKKKEKIILLAPLQREIFYVHQRVHVEMNRLKTIATWIPLILQLKT